MSLAASQRRTGIRDVFWCYKSLDDPGVQPADAPSLGTWHLLVWARENRDHLYAKLLPRALVAHAKLERHDKIPSPPPQLQCDPAMGPFDTQEIEQEWARHGLATDPLSLEALELVANWSEEVGAAPNIRCVAALVAVTVDVVQTAVEAAKRNPQAFVKYCTPSAAPG
jgi:hypothetical protein